MQKISVVSLLAEGLGSAWLLLCGSGVAVLAAGFPVLGVGFLGISLAWGLGMMTAGWGLGEKAFAGFTPVIAVGRWSAGELSALHCLYGLLAQMVGSILGAGILFLMVCRIPSFDVHQGFAGNGYDVLSPGGFTAEGVALAECVMAFFLIILVQGSGQSRRYLVAAGAMMLTSMLTVTVDNAMVSPAKSIAVAIFAGGDWFRQQWVFLLAPFSGSVAGGVCSRFLFPAQPVTTG
ncbi:aquaporin [Citrobacter koseri]